MAITFEEVDSSVHNRNKEILNLKSFAIIKDDEFIGNIDIIDANKRGDRFATGMLNSVAFSLQDTSDTHILNQIKDRA